MHTQRFQKHDKNELLYLRGDDIALMTSSCTKNRIFAEKKHFRQRSHACSNKGGCWFSAHDSAAHHHIFQNDRSLSYSDGDILMCQSFHNETVTLLVCKKCVQKLITAVIKLTGWSGLYMAKIQYGGCLIQWMVIMSSIPLPHKPHKPQAQHDFSHCLV